MESDWYIIWHTLVYAHTMSYIAVSTSTSHSPTYNPIFIVSFRGFWKALPVDLKFNGAEGPTTQGPRGSAWTYPPHLVGSDRGGRWTVKRTAELGISKPSRILGFAQDGPAQAFHNPIPRILNCPCLLMFGFGSTKSSGPFAAYETL